MTRNFTDMQQGRLWLRLPGKLRACLELARLDRPTGIWLLLFPCWWSLALAGGSPPKLYLIFAIGAIVMRGAGCTINDIIDRRIDAQVERTRHRPLPSGRIGLNGAIAFLALQLAIGLIVLLQLNRLSLALGVASLTLVAIYPFMKRLTWWPQAFLGLTFNWGALMGWAAATGTIELPAILLYAAGFFWTLGYDTIYAHQDIVDDPAAGVRSTARRLSSNSKPWIAAFYGLFLAAAAAAGYLRALDEWFYLGLGMVALGIAALLATWNSNNPANCLARFKANRWVGIALFAAIVVGMGCMPRFF